MSKFLGKFRKNKDYNDDYNFTHSKHRNEHSEIKKLIAQHEADKREIYEDSELLISHNEKQ